MTTPTPTVGRVSPQGVTRQDTTAEPATDVGLREANPTYGAGWRHTTWGEVATLEYGKALRDYQNTVGEYPVYGTNGPIGFHDSALCKTPGVVIGRKGAYRGVHYSPRPFFVIDTAFFLKPKAPMNIRWAYYALLTCDINSMDSGSAIPSTSREEFYKLPVSVPPLSEQEIIAGFLARFDDRIALLRETNATLEAIAQALFKSWFVDFDPVRARQQGLAPEGMDEATAALFPDGFEESELGLVPKGWKAGSLADLANLNPESWTAKKHPAHLAYVDLANAKDNEIAAVTHYPFNEAPSRARRVLRSGDTIVGTVRPGNRSFAFIHNAPENLTGSTGFAVLRALKKESAEYVFLAATRDASIEHLTHVADGGAYPAVRPEAVAALACVIPSEQILAVFHTVAEPLLSAVAENQTQAQTLTTLRDTLLPRLISGQLRLPGNAPDEFEVIA
ncbi:restriction endonuclease subunit S [Zoogloea sp.]|uniref:restriction endonuclease subunit S n=1 Tax=Zoogloea sp. TaxID=49181 RepID=UPI00322074C0